ncbi:hypothetical protein [Propionivibrio sp.]|uniref:hypothetical protein n=1 Tax=Propionivibrio sp. TaxID=2212460 RepID=UPI003BF16A9C
MAKQTIKDIVTANIEALRELDYRGLVAWGRENGMDNKSAFSTYKRALTAHGLDLDEMRHERCQAQVDDLTSKVTHHITLFSDAKARLDRFAVCSQDGSPVWFGKFFNDDRDYNGEQSSGEMAAAKKAVWLASKVAESVGGIVELTLKVDAEWLVWANSVREGHDSGGKARALGETAQRLGILLNVEHIPGAENPADKYTVESGYKRWQDADFTSLLQPINS